MQGAAHGTATQGLRAAGTTRRAAVAVGLADDLPHQPSLALVQRERDRAMQHAMVVKKERVALPPCMLVDSARVEARRALRPQVLIELRLVVRPEGRPKEPRELRGELRGARLGRATLEAFETLGPGE